MELSKPEVPPSKKQAGLPFPEMQPADNPSTVVLQDDDGNISIASVPGKMNYVTADTKELHVRRDLAGCDSIYEGATWDPVEVCVSNARGLSKNLKENGFELLDAPLDKNIDFLDSDSVIDEYYPICERLLKQVLGPRQVATVKAFDHNIRISSDTFGKELKGGGGSKAQVPLGMVHGDYTKTSAPKRFSQLGEPPKANDVLKSRLGTQPLVDPSMMREAISGKRRFALMNVWRSIDKENPVGESPLACADAATVPDGGFRVLYIHYKDRVGENYFCAHNPLHKWMYFPKMLHSEAMLIKQWDSYGDFAMGNDHTSGGISTFALHSAFMDPANPQKARPRQSIEVRCMVIWQEEEHP
jgi:hypothetical protein